MLTARHLMTWLLFIAILEACSTPSQSISISTALPATATLLHPATPTAKPGYLSRIAAGAGHTCLVASGGSVKCWGHNGYGQLGDDKLAGTVTPVEVPGLAGGATAVVAGAYHTCALTDQGGVKCWGRNEHGQLGNGTLADSSTPVDVNGLTRDVTAVAAGNAHTCALTSVGGVQCWGQNEYGQLGNGAVADSTTPVEVSGLSAGIIALAAGVEYTCALTDKGEVQCWGLNQAGQLGDGTLKDSRTPVKVRGLDGDVTAIVAGNYHMCALMAGGKVKCWGGGDGSNPDSSKPVEVNGLAGDVAAITAGSGHTCALTNEGGVMCWGDNYFGQLGNNTFESSGPTVNGQPVQVSGLSSGVVAFAAGSGHTCALMSAGNVICWGDGSSGQLGDGNIRWK